MTVSLLFSRQPGSRERQLRRKNHNPLFTEAARAVTQAQLDTARRADDADKSQFSEALQALLKEAVALKPNVGNEVILDLKERIDKLYLQCAGFGGDFNREKGALVKLHDIIMQTLRNAIGNDTLAQAEIEQEQAAHKLHLQLLETPLVADLLNNDSPIAEDELIPTLLSEPESIVRQALTLFDGTQLHIMHHAATELLTGLDDQGLAPPPTTRSALQALEAAASAVPPDGPLQ